ncbi:unnamed protein product [Moneuplotes crassus]|uniref:Uncharacterized protein n=1 Tax=Euplotes crassus TaxID=5936 RepID=A0AAD1XUW2_EUPCR|nr:unnamed protein product [Moneuplotes crassus]
MRSNSYLLMTLIKYSLVRFDSCMIHFCKLFLRPEVERPCIRYSNCSECSSQPLLAIDPQRINLSSCILVDVKHLAKSGVLESAIVQSTNSTFGIFLTAEKILFSCFCLIFHVERDILLVIFNENLLKAGSNLFWLFKISQFSLICHVLIPAIEYLLINFSMILILVREISKVVL